MWWEHFLNFLRRASGEVFNAYGTTALAVGVFVILIPGIMRLSQTWKKWNDSPKESRLPLSVFFWQSVRDARKTELKLVLSAWAAALLFIVVRDVYQDHQALVARISHPPQPPRNEAPFSDDKNSTKQSPPPTIRTRPTLTQPLNPAAGPSLQGAIPQTQLERLTLLNRNLSKSDRDRLAEALYEFSQSLDNGLNLMSKVNVEQGAISTEGANIANNYQSHIAKLREISPLTKQYAKDFTALRTKWAYYREQTEYVFGGNPDNLGPNSLTNAAEGLANYLERWGAVQNKNDQNVLNLLDEGKNDCYSRILTFANWNRECKERLEQMKASIQVSSSSIPQSPRTTPAVQMF
jgi:hypothetical protein